MVKPLSAVLLFTALGAIGGLRVVKSPGDKGSFAEAEAWQIPTCTDLSGQWTYNSAQQMTFNHQGCSGFVQGDFEFAYGMNGDTVIILSGQYNGVTGTLSGSTITWSNGAVFQKSGGGSSPSPPSGGKGSLAESEAEQIPTCTDLSGQWTYNSVQQMTFMHQGCSGIVQGAFEFAYGMNDNTVVILSGQYAGVTGTVSGSWPFSITFSNGAVFRQSSSGSPPTPPPPTPTWGAPPPSPPLGGKGSLAESGEEFESNEEMDAMSSTFLNLVNTARSREGLRNLTYNSNLNRAAARHAADYNQDGHTGSDGSSIRDRVAASGYSPMRAWGENVYWEYGAGTGAVKNAFDWWMQSPGHRANILSSSFKEMGFKRHDHSPKKWTWGFCQVFGSRG